MYRGGCRAVCTYPRNSSGFYLTRHDCTSCLLVELVAFLFLPKEAYSPMDTGYQECRGRPDRGRHQLVRTTILWSAATMHRLYKWYSAYIHRLYKWYSAYMHRLRKWYIAYMHRLRKWYIAYMHRLRRWYIAYMHRLRKWYIAYTVGDTGVSTYLCATHSNEYRGPVVPFQEKQNTVYYMIQVSFSACQSASKFSRPYSKQGL